jgi:hypothetical protein
VPLPALQSQPKKASPIGDNPGFIRGATATLQVFDPRTLRTFALN